MAESRTDQPLAARLLADPAAKTEDVGERIIEAAVEQISDFGVRRFTVDELAKRVGLSRVTIYRHFSSKDKVLDAVVFYELRKFMDEIERVVDEYDSLEEKAVEGFVYALSSLRTHTLLQRLLRTEPELFLPLLTTQGTPIIEAGREFIAGFARGAANDGTLGIDNDKLAILSELLARLIVSVVLTPESAMKLRTEMEIRAFADEYVGAMVRGFSVAPNAGHDSLG